ncbi:unnamed protein product, partial [Closterium sp. NIES-54]
ERVSPDTAVIMRFILTKGKAIPAPPLPKLIAPIAPLNFKQVTKSRWHVLGERTDPDTDMPTVIQLDGKGFFHPATEILKNGAVEVWHIINPSADSHPIHLHLLQHRPFARRPFNSQAFLSDDCAFYPYPGYPSSLSATASASSLATSSSPAGSITRSSIIGTSSGGSGGIISRDGGTGSSGEGKLPSCFTGRSRKVDLNEQGWKDTTKSHPGEVLSILVAVRSQDGKPFNFDPSQGPGYVWHCHILEHEDNDMMRPLLVRK